MPLMVWTADASGAVNYWNQCWYEYTGLAQTESMARLGISVVHADDRDRTLTQWEESVRQGQSFEIEHRLRRWDGQYHWFINRGIPTKDDQGHITGWIGTITEIDQQKRLTEQFQLAMQAVNGMVYDWNIETEEIYRSEKLFDLTGYRPQEVPATFDWWFALVHPDDQAAMQQRAQALFAGTQELFEAEYRIRHRDDYWVSVWDRGLLVRNPQGEIIRVVGSTVDVSDRKQAEIARQQDQERLNLAMEAAQMGSWDWNIQSGEVRWSANLEQLFGMTPGSFDGRYETVMTMIHPDDQGRVQQAIRRAVAEHAEYNIEFRFIRPDGTVRWALGLGRVFYGTDGTPLTMTGVDMDISDRKQVVLDLRQAYIQLEAALAAGAVYTWRWNIPNNLVMTNQSFAHLFGVDPEGATAGLPIEQFLSAIHPDDRPQVDAEIERAIATQADYASEFRIINADGEERWVIARGRVEYDADGRAIAFPGALADITDRKRAEARLAENEARLQGFVDSNVIGIWHGDIHGNIHWANDEFLRMVGYTRADLQRTPLRWLEMTPPEYRSLDVKKLIEARASGACTPYEKEYFRKDGQRVSVLIGYNLLGEDREESVVFVLDLTALKRTEKRLRLSEDRLRMAVHSTQLGTWDWNLKTDKLTWDDRCKAMFGLAAEAEESLETFYAALHPGDRKRIATMLQTTLADAPDREFDAEYRVISAQDGTERWIAAKGQIYRHTDGTLDRFIGTVQDITERKQAEVEREQLLQREYEARSEAERVNRIKDEFLAILSHELRSPLNPILGWANLLQTRKFDEGTTTRALATIERNAKLQTQLIDDLLDIARILRGKLKLNHAPVNLQSVLEAAIETVQSAAIAKAITLQTDLQEVSPIWGDAVRLQQVIWNLLTNAIKFTPENGRVEVRLTQQNGHVQMVVADTGIGIHADFLPHIFESFRQKDASVTRQFGGLGLGLAIVRYLVEAHGGAIAATSPGEGLGTAFTVHLPCPKDNLTSPLLAPVAAAEVALTGVRVMLIDDNPDSLEFLEAALTVQGATAEGFTSATTALARLVAAPPDVLISDIGMPELDGYALIQQIRALSPEQGGSVPAIAITAYARDSDRQRALASGFQRHIAKPIDADVLSQAIVELLNRAE